MDNYSDEDLLPLSGIQHFAFCRRQWALIHIERQWEENILTFGGRDLHGRADDPFFTEQRGMVLVTRSMPIVSYRLGLHGVADVVEFHRVEDGIHIEGRRGRWHPHPVEYKYGSSKSNDCDHVQLCAQAICLEEMHQTNISEGEMFYGRNRRREPVIFDNGLRQRVEELSMEMHRLFNEGVTPPPEQTKACTSCSLVNLCLPHMTKRRSVRSYLEHALLVGDSINRQGV
ncbi:MAG: CRISPR-associated protein Cas4 [Clostridiales bacterium]|nr:CRISPR-associated protein Cas4 [Clostridiales bacterium]